MHAVVARMASIGILKYSPPIKLFKLYAILFVKDVYHHTFKKP